jgi:L-lactate dehydrogenase (cytochrome)
MLKARALGADGVLIGRPWVYAVAAQGQQGVQQLLETFRSELSVSMALTGSTDLSEVDTHILDRG